MSTETILLLNVSKLIMSWSTNEATECVIIFKLFGLQVIQFVYGGSAYHGLYYSRSGT